VKIIQAYGKVSKPAPLEEITQISGVHHTIVSRNNGFLLSVGIIEGGKTKAPTPLGTRLALALGHNIPEEISSVWREAIQANEFLMKMLSAVRIRKGMDLGTLQGHIAYSAGELKTQRTTAGANAVIDILRAAGLVVEEDGRIVATEAPEAIPRKGEPTPVMEIPQAIRIRPSGDVAGAPGAISVHIEVRVEAKPSELEGLGLKLRQVIEEFSGKAHSSAAPKPSSEP
jgi:hypothetical protein